MYSYCNNCAISHNIDTSKLELDNLIEKKNYYLLDQEIVELSQTLDKLIYKCLFCNKHLYNNTPLKLNNITGTHSSFYYYGKQHLFTNMYYYIANGILDNELIYISMNKELYNELIYYLKKNNIKVENILFKPVEELILANKNGGLKQLKEKINAICTEDEVMNYSGVRWIGQPTYAMSCTSQKDFLDWEVNLSKALLNTNASLICIYDMYDYMHNKDFINEKVIEESLTTHTHILKQLVLEEII